MEVFIIAEAGSNWWANDDGGFDRAFRLIDVAADAGADACKFQAWSKGRVYAAQLGTNTVSDELDRIELPKEWIPQLADYCDKRGIEFMASVFSVEDLKAVDPYVKRHKIASCELSHLELIRAAIETGKQVILSTGAATYSEIEVVLDRCEYNDVILLQCTSSYPAPTHELNLFAMDELPVTPRMGLSDHSLDPIIPAVMAVALGATVIEKHFTLSNKLSGPDHCYALEPDELRTLVRSIRTAEICMGDGVKKVMPSEREVRGCGVRSVQATKDISVGSVLTKDNIAALRPGNRKQGEHALRLGDMYGRVVNRTISVGDGVLCEDFE